MSEPRRWNEPGGDAPAEVRRLLRHAQQTAPMTAVDLSRTAVQVAKATAAPAAVSSAAWLLGKGVITAMAGVGVAAAVATAAFVGPAALRARAAREGHGATHVAAPARAHAVPAAIAQPEAPAAAAAPALPALPARASEPAVPAREAPRTTRAGVRAASSAADPADVLEREVTWLARASELLEQGRAADAYAQLRAHAAALRNGALGHEREALTIEALQRMGRTREAQARGAAFLARHPRSTAAARVRRALDAMAARGVVAGGGAGGPSR